MAAEHAADNKARLESSLGREAQPVDLYLAHFLGVGGATKFLSVHDQYPGASGASLFPAAARANRSIFYDKAGNPRSLSEIRNSFANKLQQGSGWCDGCGLRPQAGPGAPTTMISRMHRRRASERAASPTMRATETARLQNSISVRGSDPARSPQTARLAYLMLATLGR
jgi:hypothetical protein